MDPDQTVRTIVYGVVSALGFVGIIATIVFWARRIWSGVKGHSSALVTHAAALDRNTSALDRQTEAIEPEPPSRKKAQAR